jgi:putative tryptophan/tyrosine transport system substrate-binding protein
MKRRDFITLLGGAAVVWPLATRAQQAAMPVIGFLRSTSLADASHLTTAFGQGLTEAGFIVGQNVEIEYRSAENRADRLPVLVADLVRRQVVLIVGNTPSALVAKAVTTTLPIVFVTGSDPVIDGLVPSLSRPGGNTTGVGFLSGALGTKRLELLRQLVPGAATIAVLVDPYTPEADRERKDVQAAAHAIGQQLIIVEAGSEGEIETAFATFAQRRADALFAGTGAFLNSHREQVVALAARHALPASYACAFCHLPRLLHHLTSGPRARGSHRVA